MAEALPDPAELLPHQPPMRLIDRVCGWADGRVRVQVTTGPDSAFFRPGLGVPVWAGVEYLGQAAAVWFALATRESSVGAPVAPAPGMLVACRRYESRRGYFPAPAVLTVVAWPVSPMAASLVRFAGEILAGDRLAWGEISVYMGAWGGEVESRGIGGAP